MPLWDDHISLSKRDLDQARRIALTPLVDELARVARTLATLESLNGSPERDELIAKARDLRARLLALKDESTASLDKTLPRQTGRVELRVVDVRAVFGRFTSLLESLIDRRHGLLLDWGCAAGQVGDGISSSARGHALAEERLRCLRRTRRCPFFMARLSRQVATTGRSFPGHKESVCSASPACSRSAASRSRIVAPIAALPSSC